MKEKTYDLENNIRQERRILVGDQVINDACELWGSITGNLTIGASGKVYMRGAVARKLIVEPGGRCHLFGRVHGDLIVSEDAKVIVSGTVEGTCVNQGGRLFLDATARVGKVKTVSGETKVNRAARVGP